MHHRSKVARRLKRSFQFTMPTRREFVKTAGAAFATGTIARPLLGASRRKLTIGVSTYSYHSLSFDEMIAQLTALRVGQIEMSRGEFMLMNRPSEDLFRLAGSKLQHAGIRCVSYYSATIKDEQDLENAKRFAKILGVRHVTGDAAGGMLHEIDQQFTQAGLTFGIHNHYFKGEKFAYESPENVLKALSTVSRTVGTTADVGHFASCGHDPVEAIRKVAGRLQLVHLKDVEAAGGEVNVLLGRGIARIPEVMQELHRQEFAGLVAVEYEKEGSVEADMKEQLAFARKLA
jgi:sugar phosphate isomerase/epimerase